MADDVSELQQSAKDQPASLVVGIGASAGGLAAIEELFSHLPADSGATFVVVQHLSPHFKSLLRELLCRHTSIPIEEVTDGVQIVPNTIYLMPHKVEMILSGGRLLLTAKEPDQGPAHTVDTFFRSLAQDIGRHAIAVVLSGTGSDGSRGIRDIHSAGGLVIAQSPDSAQFDGMPRSAISTGLCDYEFEPMQIAREILKRAGASKSVIDALKPAAKQSSDYDTAMKLLKDSFGVNFSNYKSGTITRRLERRQKLTNCSSLAGYVERIQNDEVELQELKADLLIGVTQFFRDPTAWEVLGQAIIPKLLQSVSSEDELRVWVAGCSRGQEAYSLAALITEQQRKMGSKHSVKIFATDVDQAALDYAAQGIYSEKDLVGLDPDQVQSMFDPHHDAYKIRRELRKQIVFAPHDLTADAPFTRLHLITCRNVLIYFNAESQHRILSLFHFGLRTEGVMFLGPSESLAQLSDDVQVISESARLFKKQKNIPLPERTRISPRTPVVHQSKVKPGLHAEASVQREILATYDCLLKQFMPSAILVNQRVELIQVFGKAPRFLKLVDGRFSGALTQLTSTKLGQLLDSLLKRSMERSEQLEIRNVEVETADGTEHLRISVNEVKSDRSAIQSWLFCFYPESVSETQTQQAFVEVSAAEFDRLKVLESELLDTQRNLKSSVEALETTNEELHATNEEMVAANEELQSTNEELHSVNEELFTVNSEHQNKIDELVEVTNDLENLLRSAQIGTIFLDRELGIRRFTPTASKYCNIRPQDIGRRFDTFTHQLEHKTLIDDLRCVLETGHKIEVETETTTGRYLLLRILPYLVEQKVQGVVLTIIDITTQQVAMLKYERMASELDELYRTAPVGLAVMDKKLRYVRINDYLAAINGKPASEHIGRSLHDAVPELVDVIEPLHRQVMESGQPTDLIEVRGSTAASPNQTCTWLVRYHPIRTNDEVVAVAAIVTDISALKESEFQLQIKQRELERSNRDLEEFAYAASHDLQEPLRTISTYCEAINEDYRTLLDEEGLKFLSFVVDATRRMRAQINGLLEYSRIGRSARKFQPVNLNTVLQNVQEDLAASINEAKASIHSASLPTVTGDQRLLHALLQNLVSNSLKFRSESQPPVIQISCVASESHWQLSISDNGIGIDPSQSTRIFQVFQRLHGDQDYPGTGIGLSLCKRIVEIHSGWIKLDEQVKTGTCFHVSLAIKPDLANAR